MPTVRMRMVKDNERFELVQEGLEFLVVHKHTGAQHERRYVASGWSTTAVQELSKWLSDLGYDIHHINPNG